MTFQTLVSINNISKMYQNGCNALSKINLKIYSGEIFALLGPNGAGKTTLINIISGIVKSSSGNVNVDGFDNVSHYRKTRSLIGIVPQELTLEIFETVFKQFFNLVFFSIFQQHYQRLSFGNFAKK